jgi:hypothetical protein
VLNPARVKPSLNRPCFLRRTQRIALWLAIGLPLYVLSTGPAAWATNDAFHSAYLPDAVWWIYLPLAPLMIIPGANQVFEWWTTVVWHGFPAGYTTL